MFYFYNIKEDGITASESLFLIPIQIYLVLGLDLKAAKHRLEISFSSISCCAPNLILKD